jgi:hypothetical protein
MKNNYLFLLLLCVGLMSHAQSKSAAPTPINAKIAEVYGDQVDLLVRNDKDRLKMLDDMLTARTSFVETPITAGEKTPKLSSVGLFNKYNPNLQRDQTGADFNAQQFNVLKYKIPFTANHSLVYRIDGTNYLLVVKPQTIKRS